LNRPLDQFEQTTALQVGADDRGDDACRRSVTGKIGNRHRDTVGTGTGDLDGQLAPRGSLQ